MKKKWGGKYVYLLMVICLKKNSNYRCFKYVNSDKC